jgi:DNA-binding response OmpR family regulator
MILEPLQLPFRPAFLHGRENVKNLSKTPGIGQNPRQTGVSFRKSSRFRVGYAANRKFSPADRGHTLMGNLATPLTAKTLNPAPTPKPAGRILVVEDDPAVQKALRRLFETEGYAVEVQSDGRAGLDSFQASTPSAIVLDLRLPKVSGSDVCKTIKAISPTVPIVVLSAASDVSDKVLLLELGADDYVTKPFSPRELLARVRAALRHTQRTPDVQVVSFDTITVDFKKMEVKRDGKPVVLTAQEFKTFQFLVQNADRVISRDELLNEVWGYQNYPSTRTVDNHILKLRQKLEKDPSSPVHFRTVHGMGYKFVR